MKKHVIIWVPVVAGVATTAGFVLQWVTPLRPVDRFIASMAWLWNGVRAVLMFGVPVWILLAVLVTLVFALWLLARTSSDGVQQWPLSPAAYTSDHIFGVDWTWRWAQWGVNGLTALCPRCKNELDWRGYIFDCSYCRQPVKFEANVGPAQGPEDVASREIRRRIRSGEWKRAVARENGTETTA